MKLGGEWAGVSWRRGAALPGWLRVGSGCGCDLHGVAEAAEFADELLFAGLGGGAVGALEVVGAEVVIGDGVVQHVPDDDQEVVGDRVVGLSGVLLAEPADQSLVTGAEVGVGAAGGPGRFDQGGAQLGVALSGPGASVFAGGFVVPWA